LHTALAGFFIFVSPGIIRTASRLRSAERLLGTNIQLIKLAERALGVPLLLIPNRRHHHTVQVQRGAAVCDRFGFKCLELGDFIGRHASTRAVNHLLIDASENFQTLIALWLGGDVAIPGSKESR